MQRRRDEERLKSGISWLAQSVHQAHHDGPLDACGKHTCAYARELLKSSPPEDAAGHRIPGSGCPHCGMVLNGASELKGNAKPEPGCPAVCFECGRVSRFGDAFGLAKVDEPWVEKLRKVEPASFQELLKVMSLVNLHRSLS